MKNIKIKNYKKSLYLSFFLLIILLILSSTLVFSQSTLNSLPVFTLQVSQPVKYDWLLEHGDFVTKIYRSKNNKDLIITNGLVSRTFRVSLYFACYCYKKDIQDQHFLIFPEVSEKLIKWLDSSRVSWVKNDYNNKPYVLHAQPGEYFVFQTGVWDSS